MKKFDVLIRKLGITIKNQDLFRCAFVHRSYLNESKAKLISNERLEFLGDSVLSFLVSRYLYLNFDSLQEGELTNLRASIVKTTTLALISRNLNLGDYLLLSRGEEEGGGKSNPSLLADTFEAVLGAVYLDQGLIVAEKLLNRTLFIMLPNIIRSKSYIDAKSSFQELVQEQTKVSPVYKVIAEKGPDHAKEFTVAVYVAEKCWGDGKGKSKQEAEQMAATAALEKWKNK